MYGLRFGGQWRTPVFFLVRVDHDFHLPKGKWRDRWSGGVLGSNLLFKPDKKRGSREATPQIWAPE
jgi:hypothetical protein